MRLKCDSVTFERIYIKKEHNLTIIYPYHNAFHNF